MAGRGFSYGVVKPEIGATVYLLALDGAMYSIPTAADATALWGESWGSLMRGIPPFLASNYRIAGATPLDINNLPNEVLLSYNGSYYVLRAGELREVAGTVNAFMAARAIQATDAMIAQYGPISGSSASASGLASVLRDFAGTGTPGEPGTPAPAGSLTVSLAAGTPGAMLVPKDAVRVPFTSFNLHAGSTAVTVDTVTVRRTGLSNSADFDAVWIERDGARVSNRQGSATNDVFTLTFSPALTIAANQMVTLDVVASLDGAAGTGALSVASVTAGSAAVSGAPATGATMSFVDYDLAGFSFDPINATTTVAAGETEVELASFTLIGDDTDLLFKSIMIRNTGNEDLGRTLANVTLQHNGQVVSNVGTVNGRYITFALKNGGFLMEDGDSYTFKVVGDVVTKEKTVSPSLDLSLQRVEDILVVEKATGFGAILAESAPVDMNPVEYTSGVVTVSKKATSPSNENVVKGAKNILALVANVKADEAISAEGFLLEATGAAAIASSSFDNVKVTLNGHSLGTVEAEANMEFETSFTLNKGDNELRVFVDAATDAGEGHSIKFTVDSDFLVFPEYVSTGNSVDNNDISATVDSATITVLGAELSMVRNDGYLETREIVVGAENNVLARFNTKALNDDITITSVVITPDGGNTLPASAVSNMQIFIGGTQVGPTRNYNTSGATFSSLNYAMSKDATRPLEVRASFDNSSTGHIKFTVTVNFTDSRGKQGTPEVVTSEKTTVIAAGSLTATVDADTPEEDIMVASGASVEQTLAIYKFSALKDSADVTELVFESASSSADFLVNEFRLYRGTTLVGTANPFSGTTTFKFTPGTLVLGANTNQTLELKVVLNAIDEHEKSGQELGVDLVSGLYLASNGSEEDLIISGDGKSNVMELRSTRPSFAVASLSNVGTGSTNEELLKFTITADAGGDVRITDLNFVASGSGAATTTGFRLYEGNTERGTTTSTPEWSGLNITVAAGTTKTFTVRANTSNVDVDERVAITLDRGTAGADITWSEVFVDGVNPGLTGEYLHSFPISHSKTF